MDIYDLDLAEFEAYDNRFDLSERKELIGEVLAALRTEYNLTQGELAKYLGIKPGTYSTYENGTRECPAEILVRLSLFYGVPTDVLLQKDRLSRDRYDMQKQFDLMDSQLEEIRQAITDPDTPINPEFSQMMKSMTDAFHLVADQIQNQNQNNKK